MDTEIKTREETLSDIMNVFENFSDAQLNELMNDEVVVKLRRFLIPNDYFYTYTKCSMLKFYLENRNELFLMPITLADDRPITPREIAQRLLGFLLFPMIKDYDDGIQLDLSTLDKLKEYLQRFVNERNVDIDSLPDNPPNELVDSVLGVYEELKYELVEYPDIAQLITKLREFRELI